MYFGTDRDGNNRIYAGVCAEARVVSPSVPESSSTCSVWRATFPSRNRATRLDGRGGTHFQPGQRILVKVLDVDRSDRDHVETSRLRETGGEETRMKALRRYSNLATVMAVLSVWWM